MTDSEKLTISEQPSTAVQSKGATSSPDGSVADTKNLEERINKRLDEESRKTEAQLIAQEHRLVPAMRNLTEILFGESRERRSELLPKALMALFWCFLPSGGTATVGAVALLSLGLAWQQTRLLQSQNEKIEMQNMLAEAQRRSSLMFETSAIFEAINTESRETKERKIDCQPKIGYSIDACWNEYNQFRPSKATTGRIAALTQALRPYRYMTVDKRKFPRDDPLAVLDDSCLEEEAPLLIDYLQPRDLYASESEIEIPSFEKRDEDAMRRSLATEADRRGLVAGTASLWTWVERQLQGLLNLDSRGMSKTQLSCTPTSPERGQLLISLHAASVDISYLVSHGADFRFSDIQSANLKSIRLENVNLSYSRLPNVDFSNSVLHKVKFNGAYMGAAEFQGATITEPNFSGTIFNMSTSPTMISNLVHTLVRTDRLNGSSFAGATFVLKREIMRINGVRDATSMAEFHWCNAFAEQLMEDQASIVKPWDGFAVLTEKRIRGNAVTERANIISQLNFEGSQLFRRELGGESVSIHHMKLGPCGKTEKRNNGANR